MSPIGRGWKSNIEFQPLPLGDVGSDSPLPMGDVGCPYIPRIPLGEVSHFPRLPMGDVGYIPTMTLAATSPQLGDIVDFQCLPNKVIKLLFSCSVGSVSW